MQGKKFNHNALFQTPSVFEYVLAMPFLKSYIANNLKRPALDKLFPVAQEQITIHDPMGRLKNNEEKDL